jgi:hypothetical protein
MIVSYTLPKPSFRDWLFGIAPVVVVNAVDTCPGKTSTLQLEYRGKVLGKVVVKFEPDSIEQEVV